MDLLSVGEGMSDFFAQLRRDHFIERFNDGTLELDHHFQICIILDRGMSICDRRSR
jgi:hypothetical protein